MYTAIKNVQIIISLLKEYGVRHLVISPGSRNVPFVHSVENDPYFRCYSVVDERSAAYFALGLSDELDEPVLLSCTSSTASSNYLPAIKEAYEKGIQLIALTADRDPRYREQMENQMIMQPHMYGDYCKKSVDLPTVQNELDFAYCERLVNEALLELNHHTKGPVQINFPVFANFFDYSLKELPKCRRITRLEVNSSDLVWQKKMDELKHTNKIMLLFGEGNGYSNKYIEKLNGIFEKYNCMISIEHMSNIHCNGALRTYVATESISEDEIQEVLPDIVITFGNNFSSDFKPKLRNNYKKIKHWRVSQQGNVVDTFMALDTIFECSDEEFFNKMLLFADSKMKNNRQYYNMWKSKINNIRFPDLGFTNFFVISELAKRIPAESILHLSVLNSIRLTQFFDLNESVEVFANLGAYGIDGALSTYLGQAKNVEKLSFLVIGDLSFFYDINATLAPYLGKNLRVLLINNHGGSEFQYVYNGAGFQDLNLHISAGHQSEAGTWLDNLQVKYLSARNNEELDKAMINFTDFQSDKPVILEVFTDGKKDAEKLTEFYDLNRHYKISTKFKKVVKGVVRRGLNYVKRANKN